MDDDVAVILLTLATENAELREQLAAAQDMLMETAVDAGQLHMRVEAMSAELIRVRVELAECRGRAPHLSKLVQIAAG